MKSVPCENPLLSKFMKKYDNVGFCNKNNITIIRSIYIILTGIKIENIFLEYDYAKNYYNKWYFHNIYYARRAISLRL